MWATPIWGNPYFKSHEGCVLEVSFPVVATHTIIPVLANLGNACNIAHQVLEVCMGPSPRIHRGGYLAWRHHINTGILGTSPPLGSPIRCFPEGPQMLISVFNCIPYDWQLYCSTHPCPGLHTLGGLAQVSQSILIRRLGWAQQEG